MTKTYEWIKEEFIAHTEAGHSKYVAAMMLYQRGYLEGLKAGRSEQGSTPIKCNCDIHGNTYSTCGCPVHGVKY